MGVGEVVVGDQAIAVYAPKEDYRVRSTDYGARKRITEGCEPCKGARVTLRRGWTALSGRFGAAGWVSHSAPPFECPAGLWGELGGGGTKSKTSGGPVDQGPG